MDGVLKNGIEVDVNVESIMLYSLCKRGERVSGDVEQPCVTRQILCGYRIRTLKKNAAGDAALPLCKRRLLLLLLFTLIQLREAQRRESLFQHTSACLSHVVRNESKHTYPCPS